MHQCIGTKFALVVSLKFVYIQMKMCELSIYPRKTEFLCVCVFIEMVCIYIYIYV